MLASDYSQYLLGGAQMSGALLMLTRVRGRNGFALSKSIRLRLLRGDGLAAPSSGCAAYALLAFESHSDLVGKPDISRTPRVSQEVIAMRSAAR